LQELHLQRVLRGDRRDRRRRMRIGLDRHRLRVALAVDRQLERVRPGNRDRPLR
jgi:hypothetical protein